MAPYIVGFVAGIVLMAVAFIALLGYGYESCQMTKRPKQ